MRAVGERRADDCPLSGQQNFEPPNLYSRLDATLCCHRNSPAEAERDSAAVRAAGERRADDGPLTDSRLSRRLAGSRSDIARASASSLRALLAIRLLRGEEHDSQGEVCKVTHNPLRVLAQRAACQPLTACRPSSKPSAWRLSLPRCSI